MNTPVPTPNESPITPPILPAIPWYQSHVVIAQVSSAISGIVAIVPKSHLVAALGLSSPQVVSDDVTLIFAIIAGLSQVWALVARFRSSIQPLTLTKLGAELHPNTLAITNATQASKIVETGYPNTSTPKAGESNGKPVS